MAPTSINMLPYLKFFSEVVSHDASFLDQICTDIIHFDEVAAALGEKIPNHWK